MVVGARTCAFRRTADGGPAYPLISPLRSVVPQEFFLTTLEPLRANIRSYVASQKLRISVYIEFLNTGAKIEANEHERFWPASLAKVPIAMATMNAVERGTLSLQQELDLTDADRVPVSSELYRYPVGTTFTIQALLEELLTHSDNTAYRMLLRNLPPHELDQMKDAIGLEDLFDAKGRVTAVEYSRFLRALYASSYLEQKDSQYLLEVMARSDMNLFLRHDVPESVPFPHKWGVYPADHVYGDAGIVYTHNSPYLITVFVQGDGSADEQAKVQEIMHQVSGMAYEFFSHSW